MGRELSFWGWGYADKFADRKARESLGQLVRSAIECPELTLREPPSIDSIQLRDPRIDIPGNLEAFCSIEKLPRLSHSYGKSYPDIVRGFEGQFPHPPDIVAYPKTEADIEAIYQWAGENWIAVVPFGGGTSVVGGVDCDVGSRYRGVVSMDLRSLDKVLEIDKESRGARIQAGATGPIIEKQLAEHGLTLRHFPQSFEFSTLGGWIATRAGGHFATLYTHIDDLVQSIRMLSPKGVWESRRLPGSGAGPSPDRMVLGSEGCLGVITEAWMRVRPRPIWRGSTSVEFADFDKAVAATRDIAQAGLYPTNCRLLDALEARIHQVSMSGHHILLLGFESSDHPVSVPLFRAVQIAQSHGGEPGEIKESESNQEQREASSKNWRKAFINAPYLMNSLVSMNVISDTFETAVTWSGFKALHEAVTEAAMSTMKEVCGSGLLSCRFTHVYPDGPAPYYTFLAPGRPGELLTQWGAIKSAVSQALIDHGATITHHHAVGKTHKPYYKQQRPDLFAAALRAAKRELDPDLLLNPGVLFDMNEEAPEDSQ